MKALSNLFFGLAEKNADARRVVGIDMGSSAIKVVEVQERNEVLTLTTYGEIQLGPYAGVEIGQSVTLDPKKEQQALVDVIREAVVKTKTSVFAMPLASSFVTTINFKAAADEDISSRVRVEARKYIPVPIAEVALDWAEIETEGNGKSKDKDKNKNKDMERNVLVAAIQNEALNRFRVLTQFANLGAPPTEIECFSALRGVYKEGEKNIAIIDIGAVSSKLYIAKNGLLQRMHRVRAGGAIATKRIASTLELSFEAAEILKRSIDKKDEKFHDVKRAHHTCYDRSLQEFRQVISEYEAKQGESIDTIYLTGGGSLFPSIKQLIEDTLQKKVAYVKPFNKVAYPAFMEDMITELGPSFHVALGAALRLYE
ncbi:MAG TPA: pilus assembly protein PilM [Candidatus Paceibacterota bacterium]|nr:pilus assembly protein PilM [Candidatus Paceibacterota bacterium]